MITFQEKLQLVLKAFNLDFEAIEEREEHYIITATPFGNWYENTKVSNTKGDSIQRHYETDQMRGMEDVINELYEKVSNNLHLLKPPYNKVDLTILLYNMQHQYLRYLDAMNRTPKGEVDPELTIFNLRGQYEISRDNLRTFHLPTTYKDLLDHLGDSTPMNKITETCSGILADADNNTKRYLKDRIQHLEVLIRDLITEITNGKS